MVDDATQYRLDSIVRARIAKQQDEIEHSLRQIAAGNLLGSEPSERRMVARLAVKTGFDTRRAEALCASIQQTASAINSPVQARRCFVDASDMRDRGRWDHSADE